MKLKIIGVDVEARPGPWAGPDFTFRHMLSLASKVEGETNVTYVAPGFHAADFEAFIKPLLKPDVIIATHNGMRYDLPFLSGTRMKLSGKSLPPLRVSDTYAHLPKRGQAFSASLGNMTRRFGVRHKGSMSEYEWELAYNGDPGALLKLKAYNIGDVISTLALRRKLIELGLLGPARVWRP